MGSCSHQIGIWQNVSFFNFTLKIFKSKRNVDWYLGSEQIFWDPGRRIRVGIFSYLCPRNFIERTCWKREKFWKVAKFLYNPSTLLKVLDQTSRLLLIGLVFFRIFGLFDILVRYKVLFKGVDLIWVFTWRNYRVLLQPSKTKFSAQSLTAIILLSSYQVFLKIISFSIVFQP